MARDPGVGYKITATISGVKGTCSAGHQVGDRLAVSCHDSGGLCGFFYNTIFPDLQTFQFGGRMPWWDADSIEVQCPDLANLVTLKLERSWRD